LRRFASWVDTVDGGFVMLVVAGRYGYRGLVCVEEEVYGVEVRFPRYRDIGLVGLFRREL
jgi:hypothetical protein